MGFGRNILDYSDDKIYVRTEIGEAEIRERRLPLSKNEQLVLVSIDGESSYLKLAASFSYDESSSFEMAMHTLLRLRLIEARGNEQTVPGLTDFAKADIDDFTSSDFFSSTMETSPSGVVVNTRTRTLQSVRAREEEEIEAMDVDIFLPLEFEDKLRKKKAKARAPQKLVEVYPQPKAVKKKKRRKKVEVPPEAKWKLPLYVGLMLLGVVLSGLALWKMK